MGEISFGEDLRLRLLSFLYEGHDDEDAKLMSTSCFE